MTKPGEQNVVEGDEESIFQCCCSLGTILALLVIQYEAFISWLHLSQFLLLRNGEPEQRIVLWFENRGFALNTKYFLN